MKKSFYQDIDDSLKKNIKTSILEGSIGTVMGTLIGGTFLIGFALTLGADDFVIGLLASLPLAANLIQIAGSYIIGRVGSRKRVCVIYLFLHRLMWSFIVLLPLFVFRDRLDDIRVWIFMLLIAVSSVFASITGIAWTSWVVDLIPKNMRGRFFAKRNIMAQVVGMILAVLAGRFIDIWKETHNSNHMQSYGFAILFAIGVVFGFVSIMMLKKMTEPKQEEERGVDPFLKQLKYPFQNKNFRMFMIFSILWGFSTGIAGPFFSVYMIKTLMMPFSTITLFGVVAGVTTILGMKFWGGIIDKVGPKPIYIICGIGGALNPCFWIFATPENYSILWISNIITGICWSGIGLAATGMMINLASSKNNSLYFGVFAAVTGLFGALAPIFGGVLGSVFKDVVLYDGFVKIADLRLLFLVSSAMRLLSLALLKPIYLPDSLPVKEMMVSFGDLHKYLPLYHIQNIASSGINHAENITAIMTRGITNYEDKLDKAIEKGEQIEKAAAEKISRFDGNIDKGILKYENFFDSLLDRIIEWFKKINKKN